MKVGDLVAERNHWADEPFPARIGLTVDSRYEWSDKRDYEQRFRVVFSDFHQEHDMSEHSLVVISEI